MKKSFNLLLALLLSSIGLTQSTATLCLPEVSGYLTGEEVVVPLVVDNIGPSGLVSGFTFHIIFDPTVMAWDRSQNLHPNINVNYFTENYPSPGDYRAFWLDFFNLTSFQLSAGDTIMEIVFIYQDGVTTLEFEQEVYPFTEMSDENFLNYNLTLTNGIVFGIIEDPIIQVTPPSFEKYMQPNASVSAMLTIENEDLSGSVLHYTASVMPDINSNTFGKSIEVPWLSINSDSTYSDSINWGGSQSLTVGFNTTGIAPGKHTANISITSDDPLNPEVIVPVKLNVGLFVDINVALEGCYDTLTGKMSTLLNDSNYVPVVQPYGPALPYYNNNLPKWYYQGSETVNEVPSSAVDWVVVQLRDTSDAQFADTSTIISGGTQAGFLLSSGSIVNRDGNDPLFFPVTYNYNLYAAIYHRNHLGIISSFSLIYDGNSYIYDFTADTNLTLGEGALSDMGDGVYAMPAGDSNGDGMIDLEDKINAWFPDAGMSGYMGSDFDMNGQADNLDKNSFWYINKGRQSYIPYDLE